MDRRCFLSFEWTVFESITPTQEMKLLCRSQLDIILHVPHADFGFFLCSTQKAALSCGERMFCLSFLPPSVQENRCSSVFSCRYFLVSHHFPFSLRVIYTLRSLICFFSFHGWSLLCVISFLLVVEPQDHEYSWLIHSVSMPTIFKIQNLLRAGQFRAQR